MSTGEPMFTKLVKPGEGDTVRADPHLDWNMFMYKAYRLSRFWT